MCQWIDLSSCWNVGTTVYPLREIWNNIIRSDYWHIFFGSMHPHNQQFSEFKQTVHAIFGGRPETKSWCKNKQTAALECVDCVPTKVVKACWCTRTFCRTTSFSNVEFSCKVCKTNLGLISSIVPTIQLVCIKSCEGILSIVPRVALLILQRHTAVSGKRGQSHLEHSNGRGWRLLITWLQNICLNWDFRSWAKIQNWLDVQSSSHQSAVPWAG